MKLSANPAHLPEVIVESAVLGGDIIAFGTYADGGPVSRHLIPEHGAGKIVVSGGAGTGKTELLRNLYAAAADAGISERALISPHDSDAQAIVEYYCSLTPRDLSSDPLRLLLVDDLTGFGDETLAALAHVARFGGKAGIVLVVASQDVRLGGRGGAVMQHLTGATLIHFSDPGMPGVGEVDGALFRAWYAA
jgi:hypothetical protein